MNTPPTIASQAFALCYALLGIPLSALTIANIGKYFGMFIAMLVDKMIDKWNSVRQPKLEQQESEDYTPITLNLNGNKVHRISLRLMLITFFIYLIFGALTLPEFLTNNIISSIFLCFVSLSTGKFLY